MSRWNGAFALLAAGMLAGCDDKTAAPAPAPSAATLLADSDLPAASDFDEEADKTISEANYSKELDALDKEIAADP